MISLSPVAFLHQAWVSPAGRVGTQPPGSRAVFANSRRVGAVPAAEITAELATHRSVAVWSLDPLLGRPGIREERHRRRVIDSGYETGSSPTRLLRHAHTLAKASRDRYEPSELAFRTTYLSQSDMPLGSLPPRRDGQAWGCEVCCEAMEVPPMDKFSVTPVEEVRLYRAPLAKVLMQVQYSRTPQLVTDEAEARIAEVLARYPVRRRQVAVVPNLLINGQPVQLPGSPTPGAVLSFSDPKSAWQVTVTETAVALETTDYSTREDFCARGAEIFEAVAETALPPVVDRVGVRYIDRLTGDALGKVPSYVRPELSALVGCVDAPLALHHSITESQIEVGAGGRMLVRSGQLPPAVAFDPALPPVSAESWVLDIDVFTAQAGIPFDPAELNRRLRSYAETAYAFFRFATTEAFQDAHRGDPALIPGEAP
jgi:uncharacterized protein (TIGR04255 family)